MIRAEGAWDRLYSVVLAGGNGKRLHSFVSRWQGRPRAKQYCTFAGTRSMFQHTVDRAIRFAGPDHTLVVMAEAHRFEAPRQLEGRSTGGILFQPADCDTAAGVYLPLSYVRARDPEATVVYFPSDHFIHDETQFLHQISRLADAARDFPHRLVLLGARPRDPEPDYGWIIGGRDLSHPQGQSVRAVRAFVEKPEAIEAENMMAAGGLWNTMVFAATVETLWRLGWRHLPGIMPLFEALVTSIGTSAETGVLEAIYARMPKLNFSYDLLQRATRNVATMELSGVTWSDWGRPERIVETLLDCGIAPRFPAHLVDSGQAITRNDHEVRFGRLLVEGGSK